MDQLGAGENVSLSSIERLLTAEQVKSLKEELAAGSSLKKVQKPKEIVKYEKMLQAGVLAYGKYEANHKKLSGYKSLKMEQMAQSQLERALEYANEIVYIDPSLRMWFDRDPKDGDFGAPEGMPRIITSKSYDNESRGEKLPFINSIRDLKLAALCSALDELQGNDLTALAEEKPLWLTSTERPRNRDFTGWKF